MDLASLTKMLAPVASATWPPVEHHGIGIALGFGGVLGHGAII
jgi:hypothetical protein